MIEDGVKENNLVQSLRDVGMRGSELIAHELELAKAEFSLAGSRLLNQSTHLLVWMGLLALSTIPLLAFLVIGLGRLLDNNYWLSSLIVGVLGATGSGIFLRRSIIKFKSADFGLEHSKRNLEEGAEAVKEKLADLRDALKGDYNERKW